VSSRVRSLATVLAVASLVSLAGCANLWGFETVTAEPGDGAAANPSELDATDAGSASSPPEEGTGRGEGQGPPGLPTAPADGGGGRSGRDAGEVDAHSGDADSEEGGTIAPCGANCAGCCDTKGQCQGGRAIAVCGGAGLACVDCSTTACGLAAGPCCGGANGCGCQLLSLGLVQCQ
jgi:hypothetical protein